MIGQLPLHLETQLTGELEFQRQRFRDWVNAVSRRPGGNLQPGRPYEDSPAGQLTHAPPVVNALRRWGQAGHWLPRNVIVPLARQGILPDSPLGMEVIKHSPVLRHTTVNAAAGPQTLQARGDIQSFESGGLTGLPDFHAAGEVAHAVGTGLRTASRYATAGLQSGAELLSTVGARVAGPFTHPVETLQSIQGETQAAGRPGLARGTNEPQPGGYVQPTDSPFDLKQLTLAQMFTHPSGSGFFPSGEAAKVAREQQAQSRGTIDGHVATFGRLVASDVVEPGTQPYNILSGTVDGIINWKLDPAAIALTKLGDVRESRKIFDTYGVYTNGLRKFMHGPTVEAFSNSRAAEKYYQKVADEKSITTLMRHTNGQYPAKLYADLVDAHTPEEVKNLLIPHFATDIPDVPSWGYGLKPSLSNVRLFNNMPHGVLDREDLDHTLEQARRLMVTVKADPQAIDRTLMKVARADNPTTFYRAAHDMTDVMAATLERDYGLTKLDAARLTRMLPDHIESDSRFFVGASGDIPHVPGVTVNGEQVPITGPHLPSEFLNRALPMPNPRELRKAASTWQKIRSSGVLLEDHPVLGFPARAAIGTGHWTFTLADAITQSLFKPFALIRGAWPVRVIGEEQIRSATAGLDSAFRHPLSYLAWTTGRKGAEDAFGIPFDQLDESAFMHAMSSPRGWRRMGPDFGETDKLYSKHFAPVGVRSPDFPRAWADELSHLHLDEVAQRTAKSARENNGLQAAKDWFRTSKYRDEMLQSGDWREQIARDHPDEYVDSVWDRIRQTTADNPELVDGIADGANMRRDFRLNKNFVRKLDGLANEGRSPQVVKGRIGTTVYQSSRDRVLAGWDHAVDTAFNGLMSKPTNYLSRGPAFKQFYWRRMADQFGALAPEAQDGVLRVAKNSNIDKGIIKRMMKAPPGTLDLENADMVAKAWALHQTKKLLYDATEKSHFMDAMRVVFPFGEAFKEVISVWARLAREQPQVIRRTQQIITGARGAKIPGTPADHGFFYKNDQGQEVFSYPFSQGVNKAITGLPFPFQGNVQSLNIAGQGLPGVGPAVQIVANAALPDNATWDGVRKALMPYGSPDVSSGAFEAFFPGYVQRLKTEGGVAIPFTDVKLPFFQPSPEQQRLYSNTQKQAMAYLYSTGAYKMDDRSSIAQLQLDAKHMADKLYTVRAAAQWIAPAAPQVVPKLNAKNGQLVELYVLAKDFHDMENQDFANAVPNFIDKYGSKAFLATQSFTQQQVYNPPVTKQQKWWESNNSQFVSKYRTVAGFFGPTGGTRDYQAYLRALDNGQIDTLSPDDWFKAANHRVASSVYAQARQAAGAHPSTEQRDALRGLNDALKTKYPGYDPEGTHGKLTSPDRAIRDLQAAANDPVVKRQPFASHLRVYFEARTAILEKLKAAGYNSLDSQAAEPARALLRELGGLLYERDVKFQPVWDYLLGNEVRPSDTAKVAP